MKFKKNIQITPRCLHRQGAKVTPLGDTVWKINICAKKIKIIQEYLKWGQKEQLDEENLR